MAREPKTKPTKTSLKDFLAAVPDPKRRADAEAVAKMMAEVTGEKPVVWGASIVGYGAYESASGSWPIVGFSPRKANLVVYVMSGFETLAPLLAKLGKHKTGASCLYLNKLADVDAGVLKTIIATSTAEMRKRHA